MGDLNVHFDNPSDPCTAALNVILGNLSLEQLVNVPTHSRGHTLDWLITNRSTDVLNLTVADMLLLDHFVISFDLLLRKPGRVTEKVTSRNIRSIDMHVFRTDLRNVLESTTQSDLADPLSVYNTCLLQVLDHHAPLVTRTVTDRTSAPWMTLEVKQAKVERRIAERKWRQSGLTVHKEIYAKQRSLVSNLIRKAKEKVISVKKLSTVTVPGSFSRLSNQMMGTFGDAVLPSNIPPESLPDKFSEFFVGKIEQIRSSLDSDRPVPTETVVFSGTLFAEFQPITDERAKAVLREMPKKSCDLDPTPVPILHDCLDEITPIVVDIINKSFVIWCRPFVLQTCSCQTSAENGQSGSKLLEKLPSYFQSAISVKGARAHCVKAVFTAHGISQPSGTLPVSLPKMS